MVAVNQGEIDTPVGVLRCTLRAAKAIHAVFGSYIEAARRIEALDHTAAVAIVAAGLNKQRADVEEDVYAAGLTNLAQPLSEYVILLANGGKAPKFEADGDKAPAPGND